MNAPWDHIRHGRPLADIPVIDLHGHIGRCKVPSPDRRLETHVRTMNRLGVDRAVVSHMQCMSWNVHEGNDAVYDAMRAFPDRILGYVTLWPGNPAELQDEVRRRLDQGFAGIKLHSANGFRYTHPAYTPAFTAAHTRRLPVLLHTWGGAADFEDVRALAPRYPGAAFLLGHAGVLAEEDYIALAHAFPNVYLDPTISRTPLGLWERLVHAVGAEKVTWGSDAIFYEMSPHLGKVAGADIDDPAKRLILGGNALRLLARAHIERPR